MSSANYSRSHPYPPDANALLEATRRHAISHPVSTLLVTLAALAGSYLLALIYFPKTSAWSNLPGPKRHSWWLGNRNNARIGQGKNEGKPRPPLMTREGDDLLDVPDVANAALLEDFESDNVILPRPLGGELLVTRDPAVMNHILSDSHGYQRSAAGTKATKIIVGDGIVAVFGDEHKKQRKMVGPAFSVDHLRALVPTFWDLTNAMVDQMEKDLDYEAKFGKDAKDAVKWFGRATLDIIGKTGFDYDFEAVAQGPNGMSVRSAFHAAMTSTMNIGAFDAIVGGVIFFVVPSLHFLPVTDNVRKMLEMRSELIRTSQKIVQIKAKQIREELAHAGDETFSGRKDILHLCMRANMSPDIKEADRLSDETLAGQIVTFLFAGHETTATTLSWCLYFLAMNAGLQDELRQSIHDALKQTSTAVDDLPSLGWNEINSAPFKKVENALVETLRLRPPVSTTFRTAFRNDQIPTTTPVRTRDGRMQSTIPIENGAEIALSISGNCLDAKYFGPDTHIYDPSRWDNLPAAHAQARMPPPWGFYVFNGGPKSCIGNRFAMTEMKVILIKVLLTWRIEPVEGIKLKSVPAVVQRPAVVGREKEGSQLPLRFVRI
ncbi:uncharacterized protein PFL1_00518 [Pseudozyma flocculosa PF-1]|uniref:Related to Cytochrome P450 4F8 n=1 Tax=Pseudozyma flocculosa TaxID=84751 RepID=A0A5C3EUG1_9BASI|nr:uncharacterized protein PFL1_00518 [Pseudozyma flocculosa PF-1]EPQ32322.1 hypothetical protein PFL1_00518 [Pseudozyma flocculosa PF-1]SPO34719.1 related to Cytochrome P450 4F8 [Pseudozyma flocculosa]